MASFSLQSIVHGDRRAESQLHHVSTLVSTRVATLSVADLPLRSSPPPSSLHKPTPAITVTNSGSDSDGIIRLCLRHYLAVCHPTLPPEPRYRVQYRLFLSEKIPIIHCIVCLDPPFPSPTISLWSESGVDQNPGVDPPPLCHMAYRRPYFPPGCHLRTKESMVGLQIWLLAAPGDMSPVRPTAENLVV